MIRVFAFDLDGTLLGSDHRLAPRTVSCLHAAQEAGYRLVIATGRDEALARQALDDCDLSFDWITSSGARTTLRSGKVLSTQYLSDADKKWIRQQTADQPLRAVWYGEEYHYCIGSAEETTQSLLERFRFRAKNIDMQDLLRAPQFLKLCAMTRPAESFEALSETEPRIQKVVLFSGDPLLIQTVRKKLSSRSSVAVASTGQYDIELTDAGAQKGPALMRLITHLGYRPDEVMVFGDSLNDQSMLRADFGAAVAMGNAPEDIQSLANYVTKSNDEDGVACLVEQVMERQKTG